MGTGHEMVQYFSNGEASDWILKETGIIAMSPELGSQDIQSMTFDIWSVELEAQVIMDNLAMPEYLINKVTPTITLEPEDILIKQNIGQAQFRMDIRNTGLSGMLDDFNLVFDLQAGYEKHTVRL